MIKNSRKYVSYIFFQFYFRNLDGYWPLKRAFWGGIGGFSGLSPPPSQPSNNFLYVSWVSTSDARNLRCACHQAPPGGALAQTCWAPTDQGSVRHDNVSPRSRAPQKKHKYKNFGPRPSLWAMALHATVDPPCWWRRGQNVSPGEFSAPIPPPPPAPPLRWRFLCLQKRGKI